MDNEIFMKWLFDYIKGNTCGISNYLNYRLMTDFGAEISLEESIPWLESIEITVSNCN